MLGWWTGLRQANLVAQGWRLGREIRGHKRAEHRLEEPLGFRMNKGFESQ